MSLFKVNVAKYNLGLRNKTGDSYWLKTFKARRENRGSTSIISLEI